MSDHTKYLSCPYCVQVLGARDAAHMANEKGPDSEDSFVSDIHCRHSEFVLGQWSPRWACSIFCHGLGLSLLALKKIFRARNSEGRRRPQGRASQAASAGHQDRLLSTRDLKCHLESGSAQKRTSGSRDTAPFPEPICISVKGPHLPALIRIKSLSCRGLLIFDFALDAPKANTHWPFISKG